MSDQRITDAESLSGIHVNMHVTFGPVPGELAGEVSGRLVDVAHSNALDDVAVALVPEHGDQPFRTFNLPPDTHITVRPIRPQEDT